MECTEVTNLLAAGMGAMALAVGVLFRELMRVRRDQVDNLIKALDKAQAISREHGSERA